MNDRALDRLEQEIKFRRQLDIMYQIGEDNYQALGVYSQLLRRLGASRVKLYLVRVEIDEV